MYKSYKLFQIISLFIFIITVTIAPLFAKEKTKKHKKRTIVITNETIAKEKHYKRIPLTTLSYDTVVQVCKPWLSKDGLIIHEKRHNSILVYATQENIKKIEKFIRKMDQDVVNIRIKVDFMNTGHDNNRSLRFDVDKGKDSHQKLVWKNGKFQKPTRYDVAVKDQHSTTISNTSQMITTVSGMPATLFSGSNQVDPGWITANKDFYQPTTIIVGPGGNAVVEGTDLDLGNHMVDIGAKLQVLPIYNANGTITLKVYPEISWIDGLTGKKYIRRDKITTSLTVADGVRINIGSLIGNNSKRFRNIFGPLMFQNKNGGNIMNAYITATAITPKGRRLKKSRLPANAPQRIFQRY